MSKREKTGLRDDAGKRKNLAAVDLYKDKDGKNKSGLELGGETHPDGNTDPNGARANPDFKTIGINDKNQLHTMSGNGGPYLQVWRVGRYFLHTLVGAVSDQVTGFADSVLNDTSGGAWFDGAFPGRIVFPFDGLYSIYFEADALHVSGTLGGADPRMYVFPVFNSDNVADQLNIYQYATDSFVAEAESNHCVYTILYEAVANDFMTIFLHNSGPAATLEAELTRLLVQKLP